MEYDLPKNSVLDPHRDDQLIKGLKGFARIAGIEGHPEYIWTSIKVQPDLKERDLEILDLMPLSKKDKLGVIYMGDSVTPMTRKFMGLTGLFIRNYIDARYMLRAELIHKAMNYDPDEKMDVKVIFCPDFHTRKTGGGKKSELASWQRDALFSFLLRAQAEGTDIFLSVYSWSEAEKFYGDEIMGFIETNYITLGRE